ncbi:MAG: polyribonucleotide nucleotidyltransferase, partial [Chitinispirillaceae bacterium]|nr:polyribonucleotide nucleotidyltransferase [Chitinispirillaceae bacterium]
MGYERVAVDINGITISIETGKMAKQANGASVVRIGNTMVLCTACGGSESEEGDFFPRTVEYIAKTYAAGRIPGGFVKREGKPSEKEILAARLIDRPIRPLFPHFYRNEVQVICTVISADETFDADVISITGASCALCLSDLPFYEPVAGVRVGMVEGKLKVFPSLEETENGQLDLVVAGTEDSIMMVEGGAFEISEETLIEALLLAHKE